MYLCMWWDRWCMWWELKIESRFLLNWIYNVHLILIKLFYQAYKRLHFVNVILMYANIIFLLWPLPAYLDTYVLYVKRTGAYLDTFVLYVKKTGFTIQIHAICGVSLLISFPCYLLSLDTFVLYVKRTGAAPPSQFHSVLSSILVLNGGGLAWYDTFFLQTLFLKRQTYLSCTGNKSGL